MSFNASHNVIFLYVTSTLVASCICRIVIGRLLLYIFSVTNYFFITLILSDNIHRAYYAM